MARTASAATPSVIRRPAKRSALDLMIENDRIRKAAEERNERRFGIKPASRPL